MCVHLLYFEILTYKQFNYNGEYIKNFIASEI